MKNHVFHFLLFLLPYQYASAQDYVLTTRGDSLTGEVKPLLYGVEKKVQIVSPGKEKTTLSLFEIREFSSEGEVYHPVKGESGYVFMKLLKRGYLSLYAFQPEDQMRFDGLLLKKMDGDNMVVPNLGFKKYISQFLEDCPVVTKRVKDGEFNKKNLSELIDAYNDCVDNRTVNHVKAITERQEQTTKASVWDSLEEKVKGTDFSEKENALEMIAEIRQKIQRQEKIPNFLLEGLKKSLQQTGLSDELEKAIREEQNGATLK